MNTGGGGGGEEEEEEKTPSVESMCKSCLILQLTDKKLAKEDEHRRRRALHFAKSTHNFVCSPTQTDKKLVKEMDTEERRRRRRDSTCGIHAQFTFVLQKIQESCKRRRKTEEDRLHRTQRLNGQLDLG
jgi:hypothetical protein